ncbi:CarD family transcriptional regulator [Hathewaya histolytica]|uniref:CarD family transcriptional regulator n=1 Tax=Hathewaya histolytica TaxID=1498 RepID=A0A4U9RW27_HATHI|nr:CarD family transcriptional regulator [Hathewaya histolytica]
MFEIGDKIIYPMQGAGVIQGIEEKDFSGEKKKYYIIKMLTNNMQLMIPMDRIIDSNLRLVTNESTLDKILLDLNTTDFSSNDNISSKQRYQSNMDKIKSGSLKENLEVVYDLTCLSKEKSLNSTEKQMLTNARKFLVDEIILVKNLTEDEADNLLDENIN